MSAGEERPVAKNEGSGGGGLGWLALGVILGVAGTLAFLVFVHRDRAANDEADAPPTHALTIAPPTPQAPAPHAHRVKAEPRSAESSAADAPPYTPREPQPAGQVADDAAAAGMTSRATN
jgi:hypothetical protein